MEYFARAGFVATARVRIVFVPSGSGGLTITPHAASTAREREADSGGAQAPATTPALSIVRDGAAGVAARSGASATAYALLRACRPRQWAKNLLVLAAPSAAGRIDDVNVALQAAGAFAALCLISSATYLVNDVRDREQDRAHVTKRNRPVAAGELSPRTALIAAAVLAAVGVGGATAMAPGLGGLAVLYLLLTGSYSLWLRRVAVLDVLAIAGGFVLRALAGGVATDIYLSRWFVLVTGFCAVFLVAAKRLAELREPVARAPLRATLRRYSLRGLTATVTGAALAASAAYVSWSLTRPSHVVWYVLSAVPFVLWLTRYAALIWSGAGQAPEELILRDRVLLALSGLWGVLYLGGVYVGH